MILDALNRTFMSICMALQCMRVELVIINFKSQAHGILLQPREIHHIVGNPAITPEDWYPGEISNTTDN